MIRLYQQRNAGQVIRAARESYGATQKELCDACGISVKTLVLLEQGKAKNIGFEKLVRVFDALGIEMWLEPTGSGLRKVFERRAPHTTFDDAYAALIAAQFGELREDSV